MVAMPRKPYRYIVDLTDTEFAAFHVIKDTEEGGAVVACCPITKDNVPVCEGQFSYVPRVLRALDSHEDLVAALDRLLNWPAQVGGERAEDRAFAVAALTKAKGEA